MDEVCAMFVLRYGSCDRSSISNISIVLFVTVFKSVPVVGRDVGRRTAII